MLKRITRNLGFFLLMLAIPFYVGMTQETQKMDKEMMEAYMKMMAVNENHAL